jgi:hypothetical protein
MSPCLLIANIKEKFGVKLSDIFWDLSPHKISHAQDKWLISNHHQTESCIYNLYGLHIVILHSEKKKT